MNSINSANSHTGIINFKGNNYASTSLQGQYFEISKRIIGIVAISFASLLVLPIAGFIYFGTYQTAEKWIHELKSWQIFNRSTSPTDTQIISRLHPQQIAFVKDQAFLPVLQDMLTNVENLSAGYSMIGQDFLLMKYMMERTDSIFIGTDGTTSEQDISGKIGYMPHFSLYEEKNGNLFLNLSQLKKTLLNEIESHPHTRPGKIFIPCLIDSPGKIYHAVLLVIEPDESEKYRSNITIINPHGDSWNLYHPEEKMILKTAKEAYHHTATKAVRNKKRTFTGGYCGIDCVENARSLFDVSDVQQYIINNHLTSRDRNEILKAKKEHAKEINHFLKKREKIII